MAKLNATERKIVAEVIVKKIKESFNGLPEKERLVDEYLLTLGIENGLATFKNNKTEYDKLIIERKEIDDKMTQLCKIMRQDPIATGYSTSVQNYDAFVDHQFQKAKKVPSVYDVEAELLLNSIEDIGSFIEAMVNKYTNNNE